jgi:hypothetical protein
MFIYREGDQQIQRESLVKNVVRVPASEDSGAYEIANGGWISERTMRKKERAAKNNPGRRVRIDHSGGLTQSVEWLED